MATNLSVVTTVLRMIGVVDAFQSVSPEDAATALEELNDLLSDLESDSIDLGYFTQTSLSADCPLTDAHISSVKPILAMRLSIHFPAATVPPALPARAEAARSRLEKEAALNNRVTSDMLHVPLGELRRRRFFSILTDE